jgi:hypothetical protein
MQEVRVTVPQGLSGEVAKVALGAGVRSVSVFQIYAHGPNEPREVISAEVGTPVAKSFIDALVSAPFYDPARITVTCRSLLAILEQGHQDHITRPMTWAPPSVFDSLWQNSHVTPAFIARSIVAPLLLAYGMIHNSLMTMVIALLLTHFLQPVLAMSFGAWAGDGKLVCQGAMAFSVSTVLAVMGGAVAGFAEGGPVAFNDFKPMLVSFLISAAIGVVAGMSSADDVGHNYLIAVAGAAQYAIYPTWFGLSLALGFPDASTTTARIGTFCLNVASISVIGAVTYALLGMRRSELQRYLRK